MDERPPNADYARILLDEMYQFVGLLDTEGTLLEVNRTALEGGGLSPSDVLGRPFWEASWWQVDARTVAKLRRAIGQAAQGEFVRYEVQVYGAAAGRELVWIDFNLKPIHERTGEVVYLCAEGRNITEKKQAEEALARQAQELRTLYDHLKVLDDTKSRFFANVSHELRTPLTLILAPVQSLLDDPEYEPVHRELDVVKRNAELMLKHVNDILDLARFDAHGHRMRYRQVDIAALVRELGAHFEAFASQRDIDYVLNAPRQISAQVDVAKLSRVLLNLLSNAFKFTPEGGRIVVTAQEVDNRFLVIVRDSGPGVPPDQREAIFNRFTQVDGGSERRVGGTGLGLSIVKEFVTLHRGMVRVSDAPSGGAVFEVMIPISAPPGADLAQGNPPPRRTDDLRRATVIELESHLVPRRSEVLDDAREPAADDPEAMPTVLVVEDNPDLRALLVRALRPHYRVISARDGEEGLEVAVAQHPQLIITDLMMPRVSGEWLLAELRAHEALMDVPVVVLTARVDEELKIELLGERGADDFLTKPFSTPELLARVRARLDRGQRVRRAFRSAQALIRAISERVQDAIFIKDTEGRYTFMNPAGAAFLGFSVDEIVGHTDRELLGDRVAEWVEADDRSVMDSGMPLAQEEIDVETATSVRSFYTTKAPFLDLDGQVRGLIGIARDITEQRRMETERASAREALLSSNALLEQRVEERTADLSTFTYQVSHDLRSPLRVIEGFAQAVLEDYGDKLDDTGAMYLSRISAGARRMDRLISDLLTYSRLSREKMKLEVVAIDDVIAQVLDILADDIRSSGAVIEHRGEPCAVIAYVSALVLALENLVANALKFVPEGRTPRVTLTTEPRGEDCRLTVEDNGIGIAPEHQAGIWSMFERLHSEEQYPGTGVGLALVERSVTRMGGSCGVESELGSGSRFWMQLPKEGA